MRPEQVEALRKLLVAVIPKGKLSKSEIDALLVYMGEVTSTEEEAIGRLSKILPNELHGFSTMTTILQLELARDKISDHEGRLRDLEREEKGQDKKLPIIQAIFIAISFIAAVVALLKAFDLLSLPWL